MSRNDLIAALIRVLGVYLLVHAILDLPSFFFGFVGTGFDLIKITMNDSLGTAMNRIAITSTISMCATLLLRIVLGYYLMIGGKWFAAKATRDQ